MQITKTSIISGVTRTIELPITEEQLALWQDGACIQDAMPDLAPNLREFLITGIVAEEWEDCVIEL